jgi:hypothetical protein
VAVEAEIHRPISAAHMAQEMWHHAKNAPRSPRSPRASCRS